MYYLIIDTCVWIELCKKFPEVLEKIKALVETKKVTLIIPNIIVDEWGRNKSKILDEKEQSVQGSIKSAKNLLLYISKEDSENYKNILNKLNIKNISNEWVEIVEKLFNYDSTIKIDVSDSVKIRASDVALSKKAPFGNKNSMGDALILFSVLEHINNHDLKNCIFVSSNTHDFSSQSNQNEIHEDLKTFFNQAEIAFFSNIGLAINKIEAGIVSTESVNEIDETIKSSILLDNFLITNALFLKSSELSEGARQIAEKLLQSTKLTEVGRQMSEQLLQSTKLAEAGRQMSEQFLQSTKLAEAGRQMSEQFLKSAKLAETGRLMSEYALRSSKIIEASTKREKELKDSKRVKGNTKTTQKSVRSSKSQGKTKDVKRKKKKN